MDEGEYESVLIKHYDNAGKYDYHDEMLCNKVVSVKV